MKKWISIGLVFIIGVFVISSFNAQVERFTDGKTMWTGIPTFVEVPSPDYGTCSNNTRARDGRCPQFLAP
jgi:hypothetical protein